MNRRVDRRRFVRSAAAASVVAATPALASITGSDDDLYAGAFSFVRSYCVAEEITKDDSEIHDAVQACLAARRWANEAGIEFLWGPMPDHDLSKPKTERAIYKEWCFDYDSGERLHRCCAYRSHELIGVSEGWPSTVAVNPAGRFARLYVEGELAVNLISEFAHADHYERVATHANNLY